MRNDASSVWSPSRQGMAHSASGPSLASPTRVTRSRGACQIRVGEPQASPEPSPVPTPERASRRARPRVHWRSYLVLTIVALVALGALALSFGFGDNEGTALDAGGGVAFELRAGDGRFALSRGGAAVLRGWVEATPAAAPSPPVAAVAAGDGCVELTAHAPVTFALEGSWYGGPEHSRGLWPVNGNRLARQRFHRQRFSEIGQRPGVAARFSVGVAACLQSNGARITVDAVDELVQRRHGLARRAGLDGLGSAFELAIYRLAQARRVITAGAVLRGDRHAEGQATEQRDEGKATHDHSRRKIIVY